MYASLLISLLAAFVAMLGKQWLNRYLRNSGGSMIDRCGDRQRKCDGLKKWPFHLFIESLPVMLQIALLLLVCGLCRHMASINDTVAGVLIALAVFGVLFYLGVVIAGTSSYDCPFQTPASAAIRSLWVKIGPRLTLVTLPIIVALRSLRETVRCHISTICSSLANVLHHFHRLLERVQAKILHLALRLPRARLNIRRRLHHPHLPTIQKDSHSPTSSIHQEETVFRLTSEELTTIRTTSTNDVRCVSWVLRNITDPEAFDVAIRLAGTIRWFEDGVDVEPPYDLIVTAFHACFGFDRMVYPGSRDRAYYSGRAILWIHTLAMCKYKEFASRFLLPPEYTAPDHDHDLRCLLEANGASCTNDRIRHLLYVDPEYTPSHQRWISNVLFHLSWADRTVLDFNGITYCDDGEATIPLDATLNYLLAYCILFGSPVEEDALKFQDKSYDTPRSCSLSC